jgi:hypothetical protein
MVNNFPADFVSIRLFWRKAAYVFYADIPPEDTGIFL